MFCNALRPDLAWQHIAGALIEAAQSGKVDDLTASIKSVLWRGREVDISGAQKPKLRRNHQVDAYITFRQKCGTTGCEHRHASKSRGAHLQNNGTTAAVIITTFNHARFIGEAITSVLVQTRPADEIIVIDDGSSDNPERVVAHFPGVKFVRRENGGPSAARNTGIQNCTSTYVTFLDADDRFLPTAIESGLLCATARPECAFVYGGFRYISESGEPIGDDRFNPLEGNAHVALLSKNQIIMHATVLYRRDLLLELNGFDEPTRRGEDYDMYLRLAQNHPIASHPAIVAEYRRHESNASRDYRAMLRSVHEVYDRHEARIVVDGETRQALRNGRASVCDRYVPELVTAASVRFRRHRNPLSLIKDLLEAASYSPQVTLRALFRFLGRRVKSLLPAEAK